MNLHKLQPHPILNQMFQYSDLYRQMIFDFAIYYDTFVPAYKTLDTHIYTVLSCLLCEMFISDPLIET